MTTWYKFKVNKLVRDKTPERSSRLSGALVHTYPLKEAEYKQALLKKLVEEAEEVSRSQDQAELISELADVAEVYDALLKNFNVSEKDILVKREEKKEARGTFEKALFAEYVEVPNTEQGQALLAYYQKQPDIYPLLEIKDT